MKLLRFDSIGGASGDMILAALLDLGVDREALISRVRALTTDRFEVSSEPTVDRTIRGTRVTVTCPATGGHKHEHRTLEDITRMISGSSLPEPVKRQSMDVFRRLAEAEARVHGTSTDKIHFHEVGALDSIVDIVSCCLAVEMLGVSGVTFGPLPVGRGTVETAHGVLPLPVPAVAELLKGFDVVETDEPFELVTPTGAALLTTLARTNSGGTSQPAGSPLTVLGTGYGIGRRKLNGRPNALRVTLMETAGRPDPNTDECIVLECDIDDTVPELIGSLAQNLMASGALDVFTTPIQMKKQRPGTLLTVLCRPDRKPGLLDLIFRESTTFGVREHVVARTILDRRHVEVNTPYGTVRVKIGSWKGRDITWAPEHEDCARCACEKGVPVRTVYEAALRHRTTSDA